MPQEYWTLDADLTRMAQTWAPLWPSYYGREKKMELQSAGGGPAQSWTRWRRKPFAVTSVKRQEKQRQPAPPFTTSTFQQEASRKLNMTPAAHHGHRPAAV